MISLFDTYSTADLITAVSGTTNGIGWTIESVFERRAGFRLFIGGELLATFDTSIAAEAFRGWWFEQDETADSWGCCGRDWSLEMAFDPETKDTTIPARPWREICESSDWWINTETADGDVPIDGYVCDSNVGVFRNQETLNFMLNAVNTHDALVTALEAIVDSTMTTKEAYALAHAALAAARGEV